MVVTEKAWNQPQTPMQKKTEKNVLDSFLQTTKLELSIPTLIKGDNYRRVRTRNIGGPSSSDQKLGPFEFMFEIINRIQNACIVWLTRQDY